MCFFLFFLHFSLLFIAFSFFVTSFLIGYIVATKSREEMKMIYPEFILFKLPDYIFKFVLSYLSPRTITLLWYSNPLRYVFLSITNPFSSRVSKAMNAFWNNNAIWEAFCKEIDTSFTLNDQVPSALFFPLPNLLFQRYNLTSI